MPRCAAVPFDKNNVSTIQSVGNRSRHDTSFQFYWICSMMMNKLFRSWFFRVHYMLSQFFMLRFPSPRSTFLLIHYWSGALVLDGSRPVMDLELVFSITNFSFQWSESRRTWLCSVFKFYVAKYLNPKLSSLQSPWCAIQWTQNFSFQSNIESISYQNIHVLFCWHKKNSPGPQMICHRPDSTMKSKSN